MKITIGTQFRSSFADGNPLWTVAEKAGPSVWKCVVEKDVDWQGTVKTFMTSEISISLRMQEFWKNAEDEHEVFYASLKPGQIVHYHNAFGAFVRCEAVPDGNKMVLLPVALVGKWIDATDLPRRDPDGKVYYPYHADKIIKKETYTPNARNIYECPEFARKQEHGDPAGMAEIPLWFPELSADQKQLAGLYRQLQKIRDILGKGSKDPKETLLAIYKASAVESPAKPC